MEASFERCDQSRADAQQQLDATKQQLQNVVEQNQAASQKLWDTVKRLEKVCLFVCVCM